MIQPSPELDELERRYTREWVAKLTYHEALGWFAEAWRYARALRADFPDVGRENMEADLAIARAVNGLPPDA